MWLKEMRVRLERVRPQKFFAWAFSEDDKTRHLQLHLPGLGNFGMATRQSINSSVTRGLKVIDSEMYRAREGLF